MSSKLLGRAQRHISKLGLDGVLRATPCPTLISTSHSHPCLSSPIALATTTPSTAKNRGNSPCFIRHFADLAVGAGMEPSGIKAQDLQKLTIERVLADLELKKYTDKLNKENLTVAGLTQLSSQRFTELIPDITDRNKLKTHLRLLSGKPLIADGLGARVDEAMVKNAATAAAHLKEKEKEKEKEQGIGGDVTVPAKEEGEKGVTEKKTESENVLDKGLIREETKLEQSPSGATAAKQDVKQNESSSDNVHEKESAAALATKKSLVTPLKMPSIFDSMKTGKIIKWHKTIGEHFERGEALCDIETDIADIAFEAPEPGHLSEVLVGDGGSATVGEPICVVVYAETH